LKKKQEEIKKAEQEEKKRRLEEAAQIRIENAIEKYVGSKKFHDMLTKKFTTFYRKMQRANQGRIRSNQSRQGYPVAGKRYNRN
jgi:hypothetical protein